MLLLLVTVISWAFARGSTNKRTLQIRDFALRQTTAASHKASAGALGPNACIKTVGARGLAASLGMLYLLSAMFGFLHMHFNAQSHMKISVVTCCPCVPTVNGPGRGDGGAGSEPSRVMRVRTATTDINRPRSGTLRNNLFAVFLKTGEK